MNLADFAAFNLNDHIWIRLTNRGHEILRQQHEKVFERIVGSYPYTPPKENDDGWSEWQAWDLFNKFGKHLYNGCEMPFEPTVCIPKKELKGP